MSYTELLETRRLLAAGDPDLSFGTNGTILSPVDSGSGLYGAGDIIRYDDGRTLTVGGQSIALLAAVESFILARYLPDGSPDPAFGGGAGFATGIFVQGEDSTLLDAELLPDGKIVAIGRSGDFSRRLVRFNGDGSTDTSFGTNGGFTPLAAPANFAYQLLRAADGTFLLAGGSDDFESSYNVVRYTADGELDSSYNGGAGASQQFTSPSFRNSRLFYNTGGGNVLLATNDGLVRLNVDGTVDTNFGDNGISRDPIPRRPNGGSAEAIQAVKTLSNGQILVAGDYRDSSLEAVGWIVRLNSNGTIDASFGDNGLAGFDSGYGLNLEFIDTTDDGSIIIAADNFKGATVSRFSANGDFDESFGLAITRPVGDVNAFPTEFELKDGGLYVLSVQNQKPAGSDRFADYFIRTDRVLVEDNGQPSLISFAGTTVSVQGTAGADYISLGDLGESLAMTVGDFGRAFDQADVTLVSVNAAAGNDVFDLRGPVETQAFGGDGRDKITGGNVRDSLYGEGGRDFIDGGQHGDLIVGGGGNDQIRGQGGNDRLYGRDGEDVLDGGIGDDLLDGGPGRDHFDGKFGNDRLIAEDGVAETLFGGAGIDRVLASDVDDTLDGIEGLA